MRPPPGRVAVESRVLREARAAVEAARRAEADARLAARSAAADRERLADDRDLALMQAEEFERELRAVREQWARYERELHAHREAFAAALARADAYRDRLLGTMRKVTDAVELAQAEFGETLLFLKDATQAAAASTYDAPGEVFKLFEAFDEAARRIRAGGLGEEMAQFLAARGFEYKAHISQTSATRYGNEYHFNYGGRKLLFEKHVTFGKAHNPKFCLSVHWHRDDERNLFVVGWCGRHLTNTRS